ncbi:hypothetical protein [Paenibacillus sp. NFR01]|uniref:hypothetical protein n=1 Tax=Paenibacillus sp. NFR01 TaxID=1566279 RepID=UPI0008B5E6C1|nr:hypothetical protein [Paenibacillus sp. NFR01]SET25214.1 hypothetical protein SAMN03159358_1132 [Paenibacillus sp. NFR01]
MLLVLFCLAIAAVCMAKDLPSLKGRRKGRDRLFTMLFWHAGIGSTICALLRVNLPSPLLLVIMIYKPFNDLVTSWYQ